jgi:hypothetical protein
MTFLEYINKLRDRNDANEQLIIDFVDNDMLANLDKETVKTGLDNLYTML